MVTWSRASKHIYLLSFQAQERIQSTDLQLYLDHNTTLPGFPNHRRLNSRTLVRLCLSNHVKKGTLKKSFEIFYLVKKYYPKKCFSKIAGSSDSDNLESFILQVQRKRYKFLHSSQSMTSSWNKP